VLLGFGFVENPGNNQRVVWQEMKRARSKQATGQENSQLGGADTSRIAETTTLADSPA